MYAVTLDEKSRQQIDSLPAEALAPFAELRAALEIAPWNGEPYHRRKPDAPMPHDELRRRPGPGRLPHPGGPAPRRRAVGPVGRLTTTVIDAR